MSEPGLEQQYKKLSQIGLEKYPDIVEYAKVHYTASDTPIKLRLDLIDGSFLDIWLSTSGKYSYHWERRHKKEGLFRHDNAPHHKHREIATHPKHYHKESEENIEESHIPNEPKKAIKYFLDFIRDNIK